jgi:hypothetical protein
MNNLLPKFTLPTKPGLGIDNWKAEASVPKRAPGSGVQTVTKWNRPRRAPNDRLKPDEASRSHNAFARIADFEARVANQAISPYAGTVEQSPLSSSMKGNKSSSFFITETKQPMRNTMSNSTVGPVTTRKVSSQQKAIIRASQQKLTALESVVVNFKNEGQEEGSVFFTNGRNIKNFALDAGKSCTCNTYGARSAERSATKGIALEMSPMDGQGWDNRQPRQPQQIALPGQTPSICSQDDEIAITYQFSNNDAAGVYNVYWVDYDGQLVLRRSLEPGEGYMERSFSTHPWVVMDTTGAQSAVITVGDNAASVQQRFNIVWNPVSKSMSFMTVSPAPEGDIRRSLANAQPQHQIGLISQGRALMVQQKRELHRDPLTNAAPKVTFVILPRWHT